MQSLSCMRFVYNLRKVLKKSGPSFRARLSLRLDLYPC